MAVGEDAWTRIANCFGAAASDFGSNTAKKFGANVCHWTGSHARHDRRNVHALHVPGDRVLQLDAHLDRDARIERHLPSAARARGEPNHLPDTMPLGRSQ